MEKPEQRLRDTGSQETSAFHRELIEDRAKISLTSSRHHVKAGETLWSIAKQVLSLEGKGQPSASAIKDEVDRLIELNSERHSYLKHSARSLQVGAVLNIEPHANQQSKKHSEQRSKGKIDLEPTAKLCSESRPWKIVHKGESVDAERCDYVIAHNGSKIVAYEGSEVYANHGAFVLALPGSRVHAKQGSRIAAHGVKIDADSGAFILDM